MGNYFLKKRQLNSFLNKLIQRHELIAPVAEEGMHRFKPVKSADQVDLNLVNSLYPLKEYFLPPKQKLFSYQNSRVTAHLDNRKRIIFGIRPCDVNALLRMDKLFLDDYPDPYYQNRRQNNMIIALSCQTAGENCFCTSLGTHRLESGYDLLLTETRTGYVVQVGSGWGKRMVNSRLFRKTRMEPEINLRCKKHLDSKMVDKLKGAFSRKIWEKEARSCLSCTACTITCPTCGCFRVTDSPDLPQDKGARKREWTSCQLKNFTEVAGGHSFRAERSARLKNRIYHQLKYFKERFGIQMCVGCGRCITNCPTGIDMTEIIKKL